MAAVQSPIPSLAMVQSFTAAAAIDETGVLVEIDSNNEVKEATGATAGIIGIATETCAAGDEVAIWGIFFQGRAGTGGLSSGDFTTAESGGRLIATTTAGNSVAGVACPKGGTAAAGDLCRIAALISRY